MPVLAEDSRQDLTIEVIEAPPPPEPIDLLVIALVLGGIGIAIAGAMGAFRA